MENHEMDNTVSCKSHRRLVMRHGSVYRLPFVVAAICMGCGHKTDTTVAEKLVMSKAGRGDSLCDRGRATDGKMDAVSAEVAMKYDQLVGRAARDELLALKVGDDVSIAIRAAWEEACRRAERKNVGKGPTEAYSRFIGFVEGRLRVTVPEWWSMYIAGVTV